MSLPPAAIVTVADAVKSTPEYEPVVNGVPAGTGLHVNSKAALPDVKPNARAEPLLNELTIGISQPHAN
jgi:hypothetical protein